MDSGLMKEPNWLEIIRTLLVECAKVALYQTPQLGATEVEKTEQGERQSMTALGIWNLIHSFIDGLYSRGELYLSEIGIIIEAEGHDPIRFEGDDSRFVYVIRLDPSDGSCGYARQRRKLFEPVTTVISVSPFKKSPLFRDIIVGGVVDLRNGEWWIAEKGKGSFKGVMDKVNKEGVVFKILPQDHLHTPVHTTDPWRRTNGITRFLWPQSHEVWNSGSVAMDMILIALGEADVFYNGLPIVSDEGQRGHELGACFRILVEAGGYALDMRTGNTLGDSPFLFDEQTPVVMAINKKKARAFWKKIRENYFKVNSALKAGEVKSLKDLFEVIPSERWSLG